MNPALAARLKKACRWAVIVILCLGYPLLSHMFASSATPSLAGALVAMAPLSTLALVLAWRAPRRAAMLTLCLAAFALLYLLGNWLVAHYNWVFLLDHAGTNALLCAAFARTLARGRDPMISHFARTVHGDLTPALVSYTRTATWAWVFYFGGVAVLSLLLFWQASPQVWSTFANLLGLPLLVLMFAGEYAVRCQVLPAAERAGPLESIRAYRQASLRNPARLP
ncbi:MAG: hypothetical protein ABIP46_11920 [Polaromonas sp.]